MPLRLQQFVERLSESGLLSAEEISDFAKSLPPEKRPSNAKQLARALIDAELLTTYQVNALVARDGDPLVLASYVVLEELGRGGMGHVYKAMHRHMGRIVAIKVLPGAKIDSPTAVKRFRQEVMAAARLHHPNVVTAYDANEERGVHFLVMELVDGRDLAALVAKRGPLAIPDAVDYVLQAARGLEYAHKLGIVHRDIKPSNLLLDATGTIKILDMGIARSDTGVGGEASHAVETFSSRASVDTEEVLGTVDYISPEQAEDSQAADARSDVYSLGCTMYHLLTGRLPYAGATVMQKLLGHIEGPPPPLKKHRRDVPPELETIFHRMVAKRPEDRYGSMSELIAELAKCPTSPVRPKKASRRPARPLAVPPLQPAPPLPLAVSPPVEALPPPAASHESFDDGLDPESVLDGPEEDSMTLFASQIAPTGSSMIARSQIHRRKAEARHSHVVMGLAIGGLILIFGTIWLGNSGVLRNVFGGAEDPPPPIAVAPFDANQASAHQRAWADYLGVPVEMKNSLEMRFCLIPPGTFTMGSSDEEIEHWQKLIDAAGDSISPASEGPAHEVRLTRPFYMGRCEVTVGEYREFVEASPSGWVSADWQDPGFEQTSRHPVVLVSRGDAQKFCQWLNKAGDAKYRLPTEAEWEYACRAGSTSRWHWGNQAQDAAPFANIADEALRLQNPTSTAAAPWSDRFAATAPVGKFQKNPFGLHDMHGNVWEWCYDGYAIDYYYYVGSPAINPRGPWNTIQFVIRGGGWESDVAASRSAARGSAVSTSPNNTHGFRIVREIPYKP